MQLDVEARSFPALRLVDAQTLHHADLQAVNTEAAPDRVRPAPLAGVMVDRGRLNATLPKASWTVLRLAPA